MEERKLFFKSNIIISAILIFMLAPWFITGLAFFGVSTYSIINDNKKA